MRSEKKILTFHKEETLLYKKQAIRKFQVSNSNIKLTKNTFLDNIVKK